MATKSKLIVVGTNSLVSTVQPAYANHCQMWYLLGKRYTDYTFCFVNPPRMSIDRMRNLCAQTALRMNADYILFIDDDVLIPQPFDFLTKLVNLKADVAAGDVLVRGYPFPHMTFFWQDREKEALIIAQNLPKAPGPVPCAAVGFSLALIDCKVLKQVKSPYFITGVNNTEDVYFCIKLWRELDREPRIFTDPSISCGHILGPEIVSPGNKPDHIKFYKSVYGTSDENGGDRGETYLARVKSVLGKSNGESQKTKSRLRK